MELIRHAKNIHELKIKGSRVRIAMFSDIHWDNPKCDWDLLLHENKCTNIVRDSINHWPAKGWLQVQKQLHMMITGTYKEEYGDGSKGWHVERGAPIKPIGGRILIIDTKRITKDGKDITGKSIDSTKFPL